MSSSLIEVPPDLGSRIISLRKNLAWTQEKLHQRTREMDPDGLGISVRRIRAIERQENSRFRPHTLLLIAKAFNLTLDQFLDPATNRQETLYSRLSQSVPATHLFSQELKLLKTWVRENTPIIVVEGASGIGKSSLLSALQALDITKLLWFDGSDLSQIEQVYAQLNQHQIPDYLVIEEQYQSPARSLDFFTNFLQNSFYQRPNGLNLILALRTTSYLSLSRSRLLIGSKILSLKLTTDNLDHPTAWSSNSPLSAEEKDWIIDQFQDQPLNTLLIDNVYLPYLLSLRTEGSSSLPMSTERYSILPNIYQNLILQQSIEDQKIYQALSQSITSVGSSNLFLISTYWWINSENSSPIPFKELLDQLHKTELVEVKRTSFFDKPPDWHAPYIYHFRFKHDLFHQAIDHHQEPIESLDNNLVAQLCQIINQQVVGLPTLAESIATLLSLSQSHRSCLLDVAEAIGDRTENLLDTQQIDLRETTYLIFSMTWFGCSDLGLDDQANTDLYLALQQLTHPLVKRLKASDLEWMIKKNIHNRDLFPLMGWAHTLYKIGVASDQVQPNAKWILSEYQVPVLAQLGQRLTAEPVEPILTSNRKDFAFLLMWAEQWLAAGDILTQEIINWDSLKNDPLELEIWMAFGCYKMHNDLDKLDQFLRITIDKINLHPNLQPLADYLETQIIHIEGRIEKPLESKKLRNHQTVDVLVMGDPITASRLCQAIKLLGYQSQLLIDNYTHSEIGKLAQLGKSLILVGDLASNTDFTEKYLTQQQQTEFNRQVSYPPYAGSVFFQLGSCKACWIKGGWSQKTAEVVEDFIDNQDLIDFLQNI